VGELRTISVVFDDQADEMTFRVPGLVAIKDAIRLAEEAASQFSLPADMAVQVVLLGKTYVPTQEDGAINAVTEFAEMALVQPEAFMATCTAHGEAMKDCLDWLTIKSAVKNDSGESAALA
jgi:hypothetical protein